jgi:predicted GNAT family N-acyltransferase
VTETHPAHAGIHVVLTDSDAERDSAYRIRTEVFVEEQGVPLELELDELDADAEHVLARRGGRDVGTGRLVVEPAGFLGLDPADGRIAHIGRIAVLADARGLSIGTVLMNELEARAVVLGLRLAYLSAQTQALEFYERLGYSAYGEEFDDAGIPHRHMTKVLRDADEFLSDNGEG